MVGSRLHAWRLLDRVSSPAFSIRNISKICPFAERSKLSVRLSGSADMDSMNDTIEPCPPAAYPDPWVVGPKSDTHKQTFILLHGGGQHGQEFGEELLKTSIPEFDNLPAAYPDAKFVFPVATEQFSEGLGMINRQL